MSQNLVALFGTSVLLCALLVTTYAGTAAVAGARTGSGRLVHSAIYATYASCGLLSLASAMIFFAILSNDFSIKYIFLNADAGMPWIYKLTSYWGGLDGSMMFWAWLLSIFSALAIYKNRERHRELMPYVVAVLMAILDFFVLLVVFYKRPFDTFLTESPVAGKGLNPLLQDPYMATHPPSLYIGYVSASVPFAFGMAALITGNLDDSWLQSVRRWMLLCWYFLSQGLILGSLWAYHVLGWGGYWGWDPVENAGLLPWFTATAFLHSLMIQERRGMMKVWNVALVIITFLLTIVGTFMTRSGIVQSVHAFGQDNELAARFLAFMGFAAAFSFGYLIYRLPLLRSRGEMDSWLSREFAFLVNNWALLGSAFFVLVATLFPTISEAITGTRVTVGAPFFNKWMAPLGMILLFLTGVGPLIAWRRASASMLARQFALPTAVGVLTMIALWILVPGSRTTSALMHDRLQAPLSLACFGLSAFVLLCIAQEFYAGARARQRTTRSDLFTALVGIVARNKRRYGGYLVHVGVALMFIGFAGHTYQQETDVTLERGRDVKLGRYQVRYEGFRTFSDPQKEVVEARLSVSSEGKALGELMPAKWAYRGHEEEPPRTIVTIRESLADDLYIILNGIDSESGLANIKVIINPLVNWVWFGFMVLILGTAVAFLPERAYQLAAEKDKEKDKDGRGGGGGPGATTAAALAICLGLGGLGLGLPGTAWADDPGGGSGHQVSVGTFPTPPRSEVEARLRKKLVCMCGCGRQTLADCACGNAAKERAAIAKRLDEKQSEEEIIRWYTSRFPGESALIVPVDAGFNRVAWLFPYLAFVASAIGLVLAARRFTKRRVKEQVVPGKDKEREGSKDIGEKKKDAEYESRLDEDLDELD
jgi:cytochrome c-type biogenesis protein CcmF